MNGPDLFQKHHAGEYQKFDRVENKLSSRPDVHAFILLSKIFESSSKLIFGDSHSEIRLCVHEEIEILSEDQIIELIRCGVTRDYEGLCMFV